MIKWDDSAVVDSSNIDGRRNTDLDLGSRNYPFEAEIGPDSDCDF